MPIWPAAPGNVHAAANSVTSVTAPPLTGGQPNNSASQVFQALQGGGGSTDLVTSIVDLAAARDSYQANAAVLKTSDSLTQSAINLVS